MERISSLFDKRVNAKNILFKMKIKEYLKISKKILEDNEYQRRKVKTSKSVYSLLKEDLSKGCIVPSIVLALKFNPSELNFNEEMIQERLENGELIILDGLQRTYTFIELESELKEKGDEDLLNNFYNSEIRVEIYVGLNRNGILYRMLTLNTGQNPMSLRHQIEILYLDYLGNLRNGIKLIREIDEGSISLPGEYVFKDAVEGFNSYIEREPVPISKENILDNIKGLDILSKENQGDYDLFDEFLKIYNSLLCKILEFSENWEYDKEEIELTSNPFGINVIKIFTKSQAITGFGSAIGKLKNFGSIEGLHNIGEYIENLSNEDIKESLNNLIKNLDIIKNTSKKIGNSQRWYFHWIFRELFNQNSDSFLDLKKAVESGYSKYISLTG